MRVHVFSRHLEGADAHARNPHPQHTKFLRGNCIIQVRSFNEYGFHNLYTWQWSPFFAPEWFHKILPFTLLAMGTEIGTRRS